MDDHVEQSTQQEPQEVDGETEYFESPLDLTPEEVDQEKPWINGQLEQPQASHHNWSRSMNDRYYIKLLTDPVTFDANFTLNDKEQEFIRKNVLEWKHYYTKNIEAIPSIRNEIDLSEDAFKDSLERLVGGLDYGTYNLSELCVLFENKYKVPEEVWEYFAKGIEEPGVSYIAHLKLIDPERFKRDNIASHVDLTQLTDKDQPLHTRAAIKIIQAEGIQYDRTHGMQLITTKKAA